MVTEEKLGFKDIDTFLAGWVERTVEHYKNLKVQYLALDMKYDEEKQKLKDENADYKVFNKLSSSHYKEQVEFLNLHFGKNWNFQRDFKSKVYYQESEQFDNWIRGIYQKQAEQKKQNILSKVEKIVGKEIVDLSLYFGLDGELNGRIDGKEKSASVETIWAGGYNIQCLHFRVLIKELK